MGGLGLARELERREERARLCNPARFYLTCLDLPLPRGDTSWQHMLAAGNDCAFITMMGYDVDTFDFILESGFRTLWDSTAIERSDVSSSGAPRLNRCSLDAMGGLGIVLHYIHSCMTQTSLQQIFGLVPTMVDRYINFAMKILDATLKGMVDAHVWWPTVGKIQDFGKMITESHPRLEGAFGSIDGLNLPVEVPEDPGMENATYNGWTHNHYSSQIFVFGPDGTILQAMLNAPGSWHNSRIACPIYDQLIRGTQDGHYLVADTAFPRGTSHKIKAALKSRERLPRSLSARQERLALDRELLSYHQTAEWGMRSLQGGFGWLCVPLHVDANQCLRLLRVVTRAFNLRVRRVGISQIHAVYCDIWHQAEGDAMWTDFASMVLGDIHKHDRVAHFRTMAVAE
ncbi:hypothetical protein K439DRAFT_1648714 [Ramaria rubella]|nr:hypothetical protein K439DRAFT_1648714 [Ramaria rubella]